MEVADPTAMTAPPSEPAVVTGGLVALTTVVLNGLLIFGQLNLTTDQKTYLLGAIAVIAPIAAGFWIRFKVWSPATVAHIVETYRDELAKHQRAAEVAQAQSDANRQTLDAALPAAIQGVLAQLPGSLAAPPSAQGPSPVRRAAEPPPDLLAPQRPIQDQQSAFSLMPHEPWDTGTGDYDPGYGYQPQYDPPPSEGYRPARHAGPEGRAPRE